MDKPWSEWALTRRQGGRRLVGMVRDNSSGYSDGSGDGSGSGYADGVLCRMLRH